MMNCSFQIRQPCSETIFKQNWSDLRKQPSSLFNWWAYKTVVKVWVDCSSALVNEWSTKITNGPLKIPAPNVINKFESSVGRLQWNKVLWLDVPSPMTIINQSKCFISVYHSYTIHKFVYGIDSCSWSFKEKFPHKFMLRWSGAVWLVEIFTHIQTKCLKRAELKFMQHFLFWDML